MDSGHANGGSRYEAEARLGQVPLRHWDELVLPEQVLELLRTIPSGFETHENGVTARTRGAGGRKPVLFIGREGTGKTMAARIIAAELDLPFRELDLTAELREQSGNLEDAVAEAFSTAAVVVVDGAAPLVQRSGQLDGSGPLASQADGRAPDRDPEVLERVRSDLFGRAESYDGPVIFISTATRGIDPALAGQFDVVVNFPFPDTEARKEIWRASLPPDARLTESTLDYVASWLQWPGGTIHRCSLAAAEAAAKEGVPVHLRHLSRVIDREGLRGREAPQGAPVPSGRRQAAPPPRPYLRGAPGLVALGAVVAVAIVVLFLAGRTSSPSSGNVSLRNASLDTAQVSFPSNWRLEPAASAPSLGLTNELSLASSSPARGVMVIGKTAAGSSSPLPNSLLTTVSPGVAPQIVKLDRAVFYRYLSSPAAGGARQSIYAMPTSAGTIVGVCRTDGSPSGAFMSSCERVLGTIKLTSGTALPLALSTNYAHTLNSVIARLNAVRAAAGAQLAAAKTAHTQALAATTLSHAHAQAAAALDQVVAGAASAANRVLARALVATANAYGALASAAAHNDAAAYNAARSALARATVALNFAFGQLRSLGYHLA